MIRMYQVMRMCRARTIFYKFYKISSKTSEIVSFQNSFGFFGYFSNSRKIRQVKQSQGVSVNSKDSIRPIKWVFNFYRKTIRKIDKVKVKIKAIESKDKKFEKRSKSCSGADANASALVYWLQIDIHFT